MSVPGATSQRVIDVTSPPDISVTAEVGEAYADFLHAQLLAAWSLVESPPAAVSLAIVDDQTMSRLHEQFMNEAGPTDVLTFELAHDAAGRVTEGEIVVCLPVAQDQARERGHAVEHELLLYAIHGLLHLCGFDDRDESSYRQMHAREDEILAELGVGPVFSRRTD